MSENLYSLALNDSNGVEQGLDYTKSEPELCLVVDKASDSDSVDTKSVSVRGRMTISF